MVLLFLGVVFLLLGWQALSSSRHHVDESASPVPSVTRTTPAHAAAPAPPKPPANPAPVRVYNISQKSGVAARTRDQLTAAGFKVTQVGDLSLPHVTATTVYYTDADGEHATADAVGQKLHARVQKRLPELLPLPPGVLVAVTQ